MTPEIVYFTFTPFDELTQGGTANYFDAHLQNLARMSPRLRVLHLGMEDSLPVRSHPRLPNIQHLISTTNRLTITSLCRWCVRSNRYITAPTLLYLPYASPTAFVAAAWKHLAKYPVSVYLRFTWSPSTFASHGVGSSRKRLLDKLCTFAALRCADWVGAGSERLRSEATANGLPVSRVSITTNFVDVERLPLKQSYSIKDRRPKVLFVGALRKQKRVEWLIKAAASLPIEIHVIGDGPERQKLQALATGLPVFFHGNISNVDISPHLIASDVFALPSIIEGVPKALLEAMAAGLPCVGCDTLGVEEWLTNGRGLLCENNEEAFLNALRLLCESEEMRTTVGRSGSQYARTAHCPDSTLAADREWIRAALAQLASKAMSDMITKN